MTKPMRLIVALTIVVFPAVFGWYFRNPLIIPILGALYVPLYFLGKASAWQALRHGSRSVILKAVPATYLVQCVLVAVFYLVGLGLGTIFADQAMAPSIEARDIAWIAGFAVLMLAATTYIALAEDSPAAASDGGAAAADEAGEDDEFNVLPRRVTPQSFYHSWHFSRQNYTRTALVDTVDHKGEKPKRAPKRASEAMIAEAEARLGVVLPETLREIYKIQDGGSLPTYYVPKYEGAPKAYEDWVTAFADDYNDLKPLARLETLYDGYMEYFDPEYSDPSEKEDWLPGSEHLVILTARTGYGTALDYRNGPEPGVLLFDNNQDEPELMRFDSFDDFMAALREIVDDVDDYDLDDDRVDVAFGKPPNPLDPDRFWAQGSPGAGATLKDWQAAGTSLGVTLPAELLPFYKAANGGMSAFKVALAAKDGDPPLHVFPTGPYVYAGLFSKLEHFATLATLSDRLDFIDGRTPWRDLYERPESLIVISAAFDSAILLDYRGGAEPAVLAVGDLDDPDTAITFETVTDLLSRLRQYGLPQFEEKNEIGDDRISARGADAATFWMPGGGGAPVGQEVLDGFIERWDYKMHGLPQALSAIYELQNGGKVRFRFAPPQQINDHGHAMREQSAKTWVDVFPDGLLPMEHWQSFDQWRRDQGLARNQSLFELTRIKEPYGKDAEDALKLDLFVIGDHASPDARMITLLDMSRDFFNRSRDILTLRYDAEADRFDIIFGPIMCDNIYSGLFQTLKAGKADL